VSRVGRKPITITKDIQVKVADDYIMVKGPKGELKQKLDAEVIIEIAEEEIQVKTLVGKKANKAKQGLFRALIANMVKGVTEEFSKELILTGVGYRVQLENKQLNFTLGYSHPIVFKQPDGINFFIEGQNKLKVTGIDKQQVGQVAAKLRELRPPDPYKSKGVKYSDEIIIKKQGKSVKK
jgi:large subunit ribosomal protein L6